jgi:hypothetical protein
VFVKLGIAFIVLLLVLLIGGDLVAEGIAEDQIASIAHQQIQDAGPTTASIESFPFLGRLAFGGVVKRVVVRQEDVVAGPLQVASVTVDLRGVHIDRGRLLGDREVFLTGIDRGTVTATVTDDEVSRLVRTTVVFTPDIATATVNGVEIRARATVEEGALVLTAEGLPALRLPIPEIPLVPCVAEATIREGVVDLSCSIDEIPPELLRRAQQAVNA